MLKGVDKKPCMCSSRREIYISKEEIKFPSLPPQNVEDFLFLDGGLDFAFSDTSRSPIKT